ncbi:hypothetical protein FSP39_015720 [Pinctada imbricata]|uniref:Uncharacterized protein n=1 Tax=Pinctada imbricata TaxID=66713 RepID=A0AA88YJY1_PINIB|nr:hypothetical protein FSP39_015720 [Pinctada imbricata]
MSLTGCLFVGASQLKYIDQYVRGEGVRVRSVSGYRVEEFWGLIENDVPFHNVSILFF